jgi:hypothetical protein
MADSEQTEPRKKNYLRPRHIERAKKLAQVSELYIKGKTQLEIGIALGCSQQQVSYDIKAIHAEWLKRATWNLGLAKSRELAKVDELERTYWVAWGRSLEQAQRAVSGEKTKGEDKELSSQVTLEDRVGDPRFLAGVQWCIERRCKILGIDAPEKKALTDPTGTKPYTPNIIRVREYLAKDSQAEEETTGDDDSGF